MAIELEGFIKGITDKNWYETRGCKIWSDWCSPKKVPYGNDEETKRKMYSEKDLGPIYGFQWRCFNGTYDGPYDGIKELPNDGVDQLKNAIETLKKDPLNRRIIVNSWNPCQIKDMALPPCHSFFQFLSDGENLSLGFYMRSYDYVLGAPFNISSYGLLLELMAREVGMKADKLINFSMDTHIYENQMDNLKVQMERKPFALPKLNIPDFNGIFNWTHEQISLVDYEFHPKIDYPIAV